MRGIGRTLEERLRIEAEHDALDVPAPRHAHDRRGARSSAATSSPSGRTTACSRTPFATRACCSVRFTVPPSPP